MPGGNYLASGARGTPATPCATIAPKSSDRVKYWCKPNVCSVPLPVRDALGSRTGNVETLLGWGGLTCFHRCVVHRSGEYTGVGGWGDVDRSVCASIQMGIGGVWEWCVGCGGKQWHESGDDQSGRGDVDRSVCACRHLAERGVWQWYVGCGGKHGRESGDDQSGRGDVDRSVCG